MNKTSFDVIGVPDVGPVGIAKRSDGEGRPYISIPGIVMGTHVNRGPIGPGTVYDLVYLAESQRGSVESYLRYRGLDKGYESQIDWEPMQQIRVSGIMVEFCSQRRY